MPQERIIKSHHNDDYNFVTRRIPDHQIDHESKNAKSRQGMFWLNTS